MMMKRLLIYIIISILFCADAFAASDRLQVCVTVPELGNLVREVGGEHVAVTVFAKGPEDPHFVEAKPGFITALSRADLFIQTGLELEMSWAPLLQQNARNSKVLRGASGFIDVSTVIAPLDIPQGIVDRAMGDVHADGNPHFLLDPVNGIKVARLLRERLAELRPQWKADFENGYEQFRKKIAAALIGEKLVEKYDVEKLSILADNGRLNDFLEKQGDASKLSGWLGEMKPYTGTKVVVDHNLWVYFTHRFGLTIVGSLEPKPGIQPSTRHLGELVKKMKASGVKIVLSSPYYDPRHAQFVSRNTGATVLAMANQVGARSGTDNYLSLIDYNVKQMKEALTDGRTKTR